MSELYLRVVYDIEGAKSTDEIEWAKKVAMDIYHKTVKRLNEEFIKLFNDKWNEQYPNLKDYWNFPGYQEGYERLFQNIADAYSEVLGCNEKTHRMVRLIGGAECLTIKYGDPIGVGTMKVKIVNF